MEEDIPFGYCKCGCGQKTNIRKETRRKRGYIKGQPCDFIVGHGRRIKAQPFQEKLCECGCGQSAPIAKYHCKPRGWVKGQPKRFVSGHNAKAIHNKGEQKSINDIFWSFADIRDEDECWEWKGTKYSGGYGRIMIDRVWYYAHRHAFIISGGVLTEEKNCVCHRCDNPKCVNPKHLFAGSQKDNAQDKSRKGRCHDNKGEKHGNAKLTNQDVAKMFALKGTISQQRIADIFGVHQGHVNRIFNKKRWSHISNNEYKAP